MNSENHWLATFVIVILIGVIIIIASLPLGIDQALNSAIRLTSIFLGVLAGVSLGEYLKNRNNMQSGQRLMRDLLAELLVNRQLIERRGILRKGFWILGIRSGRAQYLPERQRFDLWHIYSLITHYNDDLQHVHTLEIASAGRSSPDTMESELNRLAIHITHRIDRFLESCPPSVVDAARTIVESESTILGDVMGQ